MRGVVIAGDGAYHPMDVELWFVTDKEYELLMEVDKGWKFVEPAVCISVDRLMDAIGGEDENG